MGLRPTKIRSIVAQLRRLLILFFFIRSSSRPRRRSLTSPASCRNPDLHRARAQRTAPPLPDDVVAAILRRPPHGAIAESRRFCKGMARRRRRPRAAAPAPSASGIFVNLIDHWCPRFLTRLPASHGASPPRRLPASLSVDRRHHCQTACSQRAAAAGHGRAQPGSSILQEALCYVNCAGASNLGKL
ncbi:unnamed protein product [Urochloa humidicola]